jgi:hypothetical protein
MAKKRKLVDDVTREKSEEIIKHAKKKGYDIGERITSKGSVLGSKIKKKTKSGIESGLKARKNFKNSKSKDLDLLKKLGDLQKAGILTKKEFEEKKKKILSKI